MVTLTGGAGAGKTTLAAALAAGAGAGGGAVVLHGDDYYFGAPGRGVWVPDEAGVPRLDVGDPRSQDLERLARDVAAATAPVVVVEGLFARMVATAPEVERLDVFVELAADLRLARKIRRKCVDGDFPVEVLLRNYLESRREAHARYVEPLRRGCRLVVDGSRSAEETARLVWAAVGPGHGPAGG
ncbi:hypothetical protein [Kitasatospora sp. MMS16-BH015]|uniref:hypothetical protein n=1 Tax=Kitasatospora sp. MMS16-BH015 TaxID=2018025 RepID=UPI0020C28550|nr:hypothetical protein [Kitasatospora sp. MMS16-BH015]